MQPANRPPTSSQAQSLLQEHFGYNQFRPGQDQVIQRILAGQDTLGIMPTGAGKSICFQIPGLLFEGISVVISPLISLMKDQVDGLQRMGIEAALINSSQDQWELEETLQRLRSGQVKLLYIAPERLEADGFLDLLADLDVAMIAVDEAHCISEWGHDFRPSYQRIRPMIDSLPRRPLVCGFTATATHQVREDIIQQLGLVDPFVLTTGFDRPNLYFGVHSVGSKDQFVQDYLKGNPGQCGIIYCLTRKQVDKLVDLLSKEGYSVAPYHAGLPDPQRRQSQEDFSRDEVQIIVATNAFGMGIDKSNVRFVLHYGMPKTLENYYQEAGRAGRDGEKADCLLLYSAQDVVTNRFLIERSSQGGNRQEDYQKLQEMVDYCNTDHCLRGTILAYFGQENPPEHCGNCLPCTDTTEKTDITVEAQKILSCVIRMGERFGSGLVTQVLRGANTQKIRELGFGDLSTYGIMSDYSDKAVKEIISYLVARNFLTVGGGGFPVLETTPKSRTILTGGETLSLRRTIVRQSTALGQNHAHPQLFVLLKNLRRDLATQQGVPPYLIFSDATLHSMCSILPANLEELTLVSGVGTFKQKEFGTAFLEIITQYVTDNNIQQQPRSVPIKRQRSPKTDGLSTTQQESYQLYLAGNSPDTIATLRDLSPQTVANHLIAAIDTHQDGIVVEDLIPPEYKDQIFATIQQLDTIFLKPIKEALPEEITYQHIRFALKKLELEAQTPPNK